MHSDNTSLVNKLILLVLTLILVCLVLIVIRVYTERQMARREAAAAAESSATADAPAETNIETTPAPPPLRRPATNQVRSADRIAPGRQASANRPFGQPPFESANSGTVAFQDITAFGVAPGTEVDSADALAQGTNSAEIFGVATLFGMPKPEIPIDLGP